MLSYIPKKADHMISLEYFQSFMDYVRHGIALAITMDNHGYFRDKTGDSINFYPKNPGDKYHFIGMTPAHGQTNAQLQKDLMKDRLMLVGEAMNSNGACVILEDESGWMTLTGKMDEDVLTYSRRVVKAIINVTGAAESLGMTPHDYVAKIDD